MNIIIRNEKGFLFRFRYKDNHATLALFLEDGDVVADRPVLFRSLKFLTRFQTAEIGIVFKSGYSGLYILHRMINKSLYISFFEQYATSQAFVKLFNKGGFLTEYAEQMKGSVSKVDCEYAVQSGVGHYHGAVNVARCNSVKYQHAEPERIYKEIIKNVKWY